MSLFVVGLTGGIGSGKTAVSDLFAQKGISVIDADVIAREVVTPGQPALKKIIEKFGKTILQSDGHLNRRKLRDVIFTTPEHKDWLNQLLHPTIRTSMQQQTLAAKSQYCILSVPLLVENGLNKMVNRVLVVDVEESLQLKRTTMRDQQSELQVQNIMNSQASRQQRLDVADDVIDNNGDEKALEKQVNKLHLQYLDCAKNVAKA